jgi:UDP-N-acetylmuramate dehydrogenase
MKIENLKLKIAENVPLASYTTFKIGGNARYFCSVNSIEALQEALAYARAHKLPIFILGGGSNLLVSDSGFDGLVIKMELSGIENLKLKIENSVHITAFAGESWDALVAKTVEDGLWGLENLSGIPGTVGASPVQNIGAYGTEVMDLIESVRTIDCETGDEKVFANSECGFTYRTSIFKKPEYQKYAIISVTFKLSEMARSNLAYKDLKDYFKDKKNPTQKEIREAVIEIRKGKFPDLREVGTAGSFWKNPIICREHYDGLLKHFPELPSFPAHGPAGSREVSKDEEAVKIPLAWVLDKVCGLKGYSKGPVGLYKNQPLVVMASKGATASDVSLFVDEIAAKVKEKTGIIIEREVRSL